MQRAKSSLNISESNLLCSIENLKQSLINAQNGRLNQYLIDQLTSVKSDIDKLVNRQSNNPSKEESLSPVNCQLCFQEQENILELREHLKSSCQSINDPDIKETKKNSAFQISVSNFIKCKICNVFLNDFEGMVRHRQLESHLSAKKKNSTHFSKFLYCSACFINVPDNVIQYENHIQNEIHVERCLELKKLKGDDIPRNVLLKDGFQYLWRADNTVKCLLCNSEFEMTSSQLEIHKKSDFHIKNLKDCDDKFSEECVKCLVCDERITGMVQIFVHWNSTSHEKRSKAAKQAKPPVANRTCLFCNANCKSIQALAKHQKDKCPKLYAEKKKEEKIVEKVSDEQGNFQCSVCGFQTVSKNIFRDHGESKEHKLQVQKIITAGFEIFQATCKSCKLDYIGPSAVHKLHKEHNLDLPKKIRSRSKSVNRVLENPFQEEIKEKNPKKSEPAPPILLSGFTEVPTVKSLHKKLNLFGEIDSIEIRSSKDVRVSFTAKSSAEKVLSLKELSICNSTVEVTLESPKNDSRSSMEELAATVKNLSKASIKPSFSDLYKCSEFDQKFLINPKMILDCSHTLCKISDSYNNMEKNSEVGIICKHILNCSSFKIHGSYAYNLNMKDCALDIFVTVPGLKVDNNPEFESAEKSFFQQFINILEKDSGFENVVEIDRTVSNFPYISCRKVDSQTTCNISFSNHLILEKTEILKDQISTDNRIRQLLLLVKAWARDKRLIDQNKFSSYAFFMMVIYFLQSEDIKVLPKYNEKTKSPILQSFFKKQGSNSSMAEFKTKNTMSISQLFIQFFKFYTKFDYDQVICLPFCQHFPKSTFSNEPAFKSSAICIMDLLEPKVNLTRNVSESILEDFLGYGLALLKNF